MVADTGHWRGGGGEEGGRALSMNIYIITRIHHLNLTSRMSVCLDVEGQVLSSAVGGVAHVEVLKDDSMLYCLASHICPLYIFFCRHSKHPANLPYTYMPSQN